MAGFLNPLRWRRADWPVAQRIGVHRISVQQEPAWTDAWPHLDDWFIPEGFFIGRLRGRPGIA